MNIYIDTETQGLDATRFHMGVIINHNGKAEHYDDRHNMYERIQTLARQAKNRNKTLMIYAHNMLYDYTVITRDEPKTHHYQYSHDPFIVDQKTPEGKIYAKWLSTTSLWHSNLASMGEALQQPKGETPHWLTQDTWHTPTPQERTEAHTYMEQDARIIKTFMETLKNNLQKRHMKPRWIISSSQIGIQYLLKHLRTQPNAQHFYYNTTQQTFWRTKNPEEIHEALRGGRVESHLLGEAPHATNIDINSHYPNCLAHIRCPNLQTQHRHEQPLTRGFTIHDILTHIGISHAHIEITQQTPYGLLPIRTDEHHTIYPNRVGQHLIGTWTHQELNNALKHGWTIHNIAWSHTWEETPNPFANMINELYTNKIEAKNEMDKSIAKMLLNGGIGKLAQRIDTYDYQWNNIENHWTMIKQGYECVDISGTERLYRKSTGIQYPKYYAPIINALTTADARLTILAAMEQIHPDNLYYVDTDSIIAQTSNIQHANFKYGKKLGEWKIVQENVPIHVYGKKSYRIGNDIKLSGIGKTWVNNNDYTKGTIAYKRMRTTRNTPHEHLVGTFETIERNLHDTLTQAHEEKIRQHEQDIHIDIRSTNSTLIHSVNTWKQSKASTHSQQPSSYSS